MSEEATLRDVTVDPTPNPTPAATTPEPAPPAAAAAPVIDTDAAELGRILLDSGYTKDRVNELLQAPQALNSLRYLVSNDPEQFIKLLETSDPKAAENLLEKTADIYVKRAEDRGDIPKGDGSAVGGGRKGAADPNHGLMAELNFLKTKVNQFETEKQQERNAAALAQATARYNGRVDDLFNSDGVKALGLTKSELRAMRADLDKQLGADQNIVQRVTNGNFVDVPQTFKRILEDWGSDRKAAAEAAKGSRQGVKDKAFADFSSGAQPFMVDVPADAADSWENTEAAFAKAYERTGGQ